MKINKIIELDESFKISCLIKESKQTNRMKLIIRNNGSIEMVVPKGINENTIEYFLQDKKDWLLKKINLLSRLEDLGISKLLYTDGELVLDNTEFETDSYTMEGNNTGEVVFTPNKLHKMVFLHK